MSDTTTLQSISRQSNNVVICLGSASAGIRDASSQQLPVFVRELPGRTAVLNIDPAFSREGSKGSDVNPPENCTVHYLDKRFSCMQNDKEFYSELSNSIQQWLNERKNIIFVNFISAMSTAYLHEIVNNNKTAYGDNLLVIGSWFTDSPAIIYKLNFFTDPNITPDPRANRLYNCPFTDNLYAKVFNSTGLDFKQLNSTDEDKVSCFPSLSAISSDDIRSFLKSIQQPTDRPAPR